MQEKIFKDFVDWIDKFAWKEFEASDEYNRMDKEQEMAADKIIECLDNDKLLYEYCNKSSKIDEAYTYFLCEKVVRAFVKIMADTGVI